MECTPSAIVRASRSLQYANVVFRRTHGDLGCCCYACAADRADAYFRARGYDVAGVGPPNPTEAFDQSGGPTRPAE
jgi:hypothetical protein